MNNFLLLPPVVFIIILCVVLLFSHFLSKLSATGKETAGKRKAYACGEDVSDHRIQPDYSQFFSFAFFFTIMHVVVLVIATAPIGFFASIMGCVYIAAAIVGLLILFRR
jgi:NADH:ubiquinone oxidoreductase subunit 3 (subunit A)